MRAFLCVVSLRLDPMTTQLMMKEMTKSSTLMMQLTVTLAATTQLMRAKHRLTNPL
jgi:hypothetical protein